MPDGGGGFGVRVDWIVVPAPRLFALPLGVGAPEVSPILLSASIVTLGVTFLAPSSTAA